MRCRQAGAPSPAPHPVGLLAAVLVACCQVQRPWHRPSRQCQRSAASLEPGPSNLPEVKRSVAWLQCSCRTVALECCRHCPGSCQGCAVSI